MARPVGYAKCQQREIQIKKPPPMARKETDAMQNVCPMASALKLAYRVPLLACPAVLLIGRARWQGSVDGTVTTRYVAQSNRARVLRSVVQFWGLDSRERRRTRGVEHRAH